MNKHIKKYYPSVILFFLFINNGFVFQSQQKETLPEVDLNIIFRTIEAGIDKNDISLFSDYFSDNTYLSLRRSSSGYFSNNQVHHVLKDFLSVNQNISFRFNKINIDAKRPYGTGLYVFTNKGRRDSAVIYVSLTKIDEFWKISQISIN
ncbi:MAG: DUF4783 domain-containing protein [Bacteroidetes bacterium]|nr:DUF4783 domain-containing protein [Bacteroidota bacterium]